MGLIHRAISAIAGVPAWKRPGGPRRMLSAFARTEQGSALDMFAAVAATPRRDMRRKYFLHALDEWRHSGLFRQRAWELGPPDPEEAGREEAGLLVDHGIVGGRTLFERLGEVDFLAFVYVAESDAVEQFREYIRWKLPDPQTVATLEDALKDELFHVTYSRSELERMGQKGDGGKARMAVVKTRLRRVWEGWLRFSRHLGAFMATLWLSLLYVVLVGPFRPFARLEPGGWQAPRRPLEGGALDLARSDGCWPNGSWASRRSTTTRRWPCCATAWWWPRPRRSASPG